MTQKNRKLTSVVFNKTGRLCRKLIALSVKKKMQRQHKLVNNIMRYIHLSCILLTRPCYSLHHVILLKLDNPVPFTCCSPQGIQQSWRAAFRRALVVSTSTLSCTCERSPASKRRNRCRLTSCATNIQSTSNIN